MNRFYDHLAISGVLAFFSIPLLTAIFLLGAAPCVQEVIKHERHTTPAQKRAAFLAAGVPYDRAHRRLYVVDHVVPLELGGTDEVRNMQLQTRAEGHHKDLVENFLARCVCRGDTPLPLAVENVKRWKSVDPSGACP